MKIQAYALTDQGPVRKANEDAYGVFSSERFYVVADGVGGHQGGEVAAVETVNQLFYGVQRLYKLLQQCSESEVEDLLKLSIYETNQIIINKGHAHQELLGMASTFCFIFFYQSTAYFSHYGDSRIYHFRDKKLNLLTHDHTVAQERKDAQKTLILERQKHILTQAIGLKPEQTTSVKRLDVHEGDCFLLCSDGLCEKLSLKDLQEYFLKGKLGQEQLQEMILDARNRRAKDNITAILLKIEQL